MRTFSFASKVRFGSAFLVLAMLGTVPAWSQETASHPIPPLDIPGVDADAQVTSDGAEQTEADVAEATRVATASEADTSESSGSPTSAADAALAMAQRFDGAGGGVSQEELISALQSAADAGQPVAMWRLGLMYENGEGVKKDQVRAFNYFSQIARQNVDTPPKSMSADVVAQSFVKMGDYLQKGLPDAGISADEEQSFEYLFHAASYFGDADAQYRIGMIMIQANSPESNPLQGARWLALAAKKGQPRAQATLGDLLFNGEIVPQQQVNGLTWLTLAKKNAAGTADEEWVNEMADRAISVATPDQRTAALKAADALNGRF